ncbi:hypothetical protein GCM10020254_38940 [Streptomyces goshikiensis]
MFMDASSAPTDSPNAPQGHRHVPQLGTGPDAQQREQHQRLGPPQYEGGRDPLHQVLGGHARDPGEDRDGGEEGGQQPVGYPVPVLDGRDPGHEQGEGHALCEESEPQGPAPTAEPRISCHGGSA